METLSRAQARRAAVAAQRFAGGTRAADRPRPSRRRLQALVDDLGLLQLDSVAAVVRSHYLPAYSRLGPYDRTQLDRLAWREHRLFETWAHAASLLPVELEPLVRWRQRVVRDEAASGERQRWYAVQQESALTKAILDEIRDRGPLAASELSHHDPGHKRTGNWWSWGKVKSALEYLFAVGDLHIADRRGFERRYDLPERVLPADVLAAPTPDEAAARRALLVRAADALGVATADDLADYFRMKKTVSGLRIAELVEEGALVEVGVDGWRQPAYVRPGLVIPARVRARALLSPFNSLVFYRERALRLWDFNYRIEIYTPEAKRTFGYYVLPFLLGDRVVGRVDVRADRPAGVLRVPAAHAEERTDPVAVAGPLADEVRLLAHWLELPQIEVGAGGVLAARLRAILNS